MTEKEYTEDIDFYGKFGCCLTCENSKDGCLCKHCKCSKCYWLSDEEYPIQTENGEKYKKKCNFIKILKKRSQERFVNQFSQQKKKERLKARKGQLELFEGGEK